MDDLGPRLSLRLLASGTAALALLAGFSGAARADGTPPGRGWETGDTAGYEPGDGAGVVSPAGACEFSVDGVAWRGRVKLGPDRLKPGRDGTVRIRVRAAGRESCVASLASYRTHGATWKSSGLQAFHDWDTVTVAGGAEGALRISVPDAGCFGQVDLYRDDVVYDGRLDARDGRRHGPLPEGPDRPVIKERLIAAWNGGTRNCVPERTPEPVPSKPAATEPGEPTGPEPTGPAAPSSPTAPSPSGPGVAVPPPGTSTVPPNPTTSSPTTPGTGTGGTGRGPDGPNGELAWTGAGGVGVYAMAGLLLLGVGGGALALRRRLAGPGSSR